MLLKFSFPFPFCILDYVLGAFVESGESSKTNFLALSPKILACGITFTFLTPQSKDATWSRHPNDHSTFRFYYSLTILLLL